jgi:hypothetical protein
MRPLLLLLLTLLLKLPAAGPPAVRVAFSPLTKAAYLAAAKGAVVIKPAMTFPLKQQRGRIVIPTAKGPKVFQDITLDMSFDNQVRYDYLGYIEYLKYHVVEDHFDGGYWGRHSFHLVGVNGQDLVLPAIFRYSPNMHQLVAATDGKDVGHYSQSIQHYRLGNNGWRQVWKIEFAEEAANWATDEIHWLSNSTLLLKKKMWTGKTPGSTYTYAKLEIH